LGNEASGFRRGEPDEVALARQIRTLVLRESKRANVGHIGSALSVADIIAALYARILDPSRTDAERDRFVLSKGHAALALYAALFARGAITDEQLRSYCADGSLLGVHPEHHLPGIDFSTGSLGHGLSLAAGAALAAKMGGSPRRAFVLLSDAECNEGSIWEGAMFAKHHGLSNLVAILDMNGQQALGYTKDVLDLDRMADRWAACGWSVLELDGHDAPGLARSIEELDVRAGPPHAIIARTVFGKGVSFMENMIEWHYLPMSDSQYAQAVAEIGDE
jgi:transketolase